MAIQSINPATEEILQAFDELSDKQIQDKLNTAQESYLKWKNSSFNERKEKMCKMAMLYRKNSEELAKLATLEMGKTFAQAKAEVEKCAWAMDYYAENAERFLRPEEIETDNTKSYVRFDSMGIIFAIMPWNFPYWQAIRAIAPNLMAGNVVLLKHASNVPQCALKIEEMALQAGFEKGVFQTLLIGSNKVEPIIEDFRIKGVTLTGSELAGSKVAEAAGRNIKKTVLELGGSDPFIVLADCDLDTTVDQAAIARLQNNGQSCIAAKRFILHKDIADSFINKFKEKFESYKLGNPIEESTQIGPVVNKQSLDDLKKLIDDAVKNGAELITGGLAKENKGFFCKPTILKGINKKMRIYYEEAFGPVASVYVVNSEDEAVELANDTEFGLGATIWTSNLKKAEALAAKIISGNVYINQIVRSHPALPFGGINKSGYGRELSHYGLREFVNVKTVVVN